MSRYAFLLVGVTLWSIPAWAGSEDPKAATPPTPKSKAKKPAKRSVGILGVLAAPRPTEATFDYGPIKGPLQLADLRRATLARRVAIESCARVQRTGAIVLALFVRPDGTVLARRLRTTGTLKPIWVANCVQRELQRLRLDALGAPSQLTLTVRLRPRPAALGGLMGNQIGGSFGAGGLGLRGSGRGGGGRLLGTARKDRGRVAPEKPTVTGAARPYREMVRRVIRRHLQHVRYCYEKELARDPGLAGRLVVLFTIDTEGHVAKASLASSTLASAKVGNCVIRAVLRWRFPKPQHPVQVSYPFVFRTEGSTTAGTIPRLTVEKPQLKSGYPKEIIRRVIRKHLAELRACYQRALTKQMRPSDRLVVAFTIDSKGGVARASIASSTSHLPEMHECVLGAIRSWRFPPPQGGGIVQVSYPFVFRPEM